MRQHPRRSQRRERKIKFPLNLYCEGQQEKLYFGRLRDIVNKADDATMQIDLNTENCAGGSAKKIAQKACGFTYLKTQPPFAVFDHDLKNEEFRDAIDICLKNKIHMGYSSLNFDLWLALHKTKPENISMKENNKNDAYENDVKKLFGLDPKSNIKNEDTINEIVNQIELADIANAIKCAELICKYNADNAHLKMKRTSNNNPYYTNPDFSIHLIVKHILDTTFPNWNV